MELVIYVDIVKAKVDLSNRRARNHACVSRAIAHPANILLRICVRCGSDFSAHGEGNKEKQISSPISDPPPVRTGCF